MSDLGPSSRWAARHRASLIATGATLVPLALGAILGAIRHDLVSAAAMLVLVAVIGAFATLGTRVAGFLASLSSALWFDYFLTAPYRRFAISHRADVQTTVALLVVGVMVTELAARSRHHRRASSTEADYVALYRDLARSGAGAEPSAPALASTSAVLRELLSLRSCRFERDAADPPRARLGVDGEVVHVGLRWPVEEMGIPGPEAELVATWRGHACGYFVLEPTPGLPVSREKRVVAATLATFAGALLVDGDG